MRIRFLVAVVVAVTTKKLKGFFPAALHPQPLSLLLLKSSVWGVGLAAGNMFTSGRWVPGVFWAACALMLERLYEKLKR